MITSSSNIHRTRHHGMNRAFGSSLLSQVFFLGGNEGPTCRWHLLSGESGCVREPTSWFTNHPDFSDALQKWRESISGVEPDRHVQVKNGLASPRWARVPLSLFVVWCSCVFITVLVVDYGGTCMAGLLFTTLFTPSVSQQGC